MKRRILRTSCLHIALALLLSSPYIPARGAQRGPAPPPRPHPDMVVARVTITGPPGKGLPRLGAEHLRIQEDGVDQSIGYFRHDNAPPSVALVWGIGNDTLSAESRLVPPTFLENLGRSNPLFEYFLVEGGLASGSPPTVTIAFNTDAKKLPRIYAQTIGSLDAVYVGLDVLKEAAFSKKALLMIADSAEETNAREFYKQYAIRQDVPVYYILAGGDGEGPLQLQELADVSGGEGYLASNSAAIERFALEVAQGLNNQYLIGYHPTNDARDGKWRKLAVRLKPPDGSPNLRVRIKSGYYAPLEPRTRNR